MYLDKENIFSAGQDLATGVSEKIVDLGQKGSAYQDLWLGLSISPELAAGQELQVEVETAEDSQFTSPQVIGSFAAKPAAGLAVGERFPRGAQRYVRLNYTVGAGVSGKVTAYLTPDIPTR